MGTEAHGATNPPLPLATAQAQRTPTPPSFDQSLSRDGRRVETWVDASGDNGGLPFMIIDKVGARLFLFDAHGVLRATTPVLLGLARGDTSPAGIGSRKLSAIKPAERITPAGRFVIEAGKSMTGNDIVWIDYDAAIALHRASDRKPGNGGKSRVARLASTTADERRISLGCVNVSAAFYDRFVQPTFAASNGIAYILPETRPVSAEFDLASNAETTSAGISSTRHIR